MNAVRARDLFFSGCGIATLFIQLPIVKMVLDDPQTFWLGVWNWPSFSVFCAVTFLILPAAIGLVLTGAFRWSRRLGLFLLALSVAFFIAMQINYYHLQFHFMDAVWRKPAVLGIFLALIIVIGKFSKTVLNVLKTCSIFSLLILAVFSVQAAPSRVSGTGMSSPVAVTQEAEHPVFVMTFEKILWSFVTDDEGRVLDRFPNLARFASSADVYANAYANSSATAYALKSMFTGRLLSAERNWTRHPNLRDIVGARGQKAYMLLDLLDYCRPKIDICIRTIGKDHLRGVDLIKGWYRTYVMIMIPDELERRLWVAGWRFNPLQDLFAREMTDLESQEEAQFRIGRRQFKELEAILEVEQDAPNLYVMHSFISDSPGIQFSAISGRDRAQHEQDLEHARANLSVFDEELGKFLDFLRQKEIYDEALIYIASDTAHDPYMRYILGEDQIPAVDELVHIFMAIKRPGQVQGRVMASVIRQIDVLPTLLADLGMRTDGYGFEGVPVTRQDDGVTLDERPVDLILTTGRSGVIQYRLNSTKGFYQFVRKTQ